MIAFRYILPNRKQLFTSIISMISLIGIFVGVWALIVVMSVMNGFRENLLDRIIGFNGHLVIQNLTVNGFEDYERFLKKVRQLKSIQQAFPLIEGQALIQGEFGGSSGALVRGMKAEDLRKMESINKNIKKGTIAHFDENSSLLIGKEMAKNLGLIVGRSLRMISPDGDTTPFGMNPRIKAYNVGAIFEIGMYEYDNSIIFMPFHEAQFFFNMGDRVKTIEIFLKKPDEIDKVKKEISSILPQNTMLIDWRERNQAFFSALEIERNVMFLILSLIIMVAALNIISGLTMLVRDKTYDIAILRTMGASSREILRIFIIAGMTIGVLGTVFGLVAGILTSYNIDHVQDFVSWLFNVDVFNPQLYFLTKLPAKFEISEALTVSAMTLLLSLLATLIPAWNAARLDPVVALRKSL